MPDHGLAAEADLQRIGDRHDLHDPGLAQLLDPLADGGLGQADRLGDRAVGAPAVLLQLLDDGLVGLRREGRLAEEQAPPAASSGRPTDASGSPRRGGTWGYEGHHAAVLL